MLTFWPLSYLLRGSIAPGKLSTATCTMATYASTQSSGIQMKWVLTRRHRNLIIVSLSRGPGNFRLPMDHDRCAHWLSPVLVNLKWFRCAIRDSIIESKLSKMRRSAFKMFHIVTRVSNEEARISADSDLTRWPFVAGAAGNSQPARNHTVVRGVPSLSISFPFPVKAFIPLACTGIERSVMQRSFPLCSAHCFQSNCQKTAQLLSGMVHAPERHFVHIVSES